VSGQLTTFSPEDANRSNFRNAVLLGIAYQMTESPPKKEAILIIIIFILLSLLRRRMKAYETTTLLLQASDLCIYVSYLNFRIFPLNFTNFGMGVTSTWIT
jgi:hypothetical protein